MKHIVTLMVAGLLLMPAVSGMAQEKETPKAKPEIKEITLTGKISKEEKKIGVTKKVTYFLTEADGSKITLPKPVPPKAKVGEVKAPVAINLDEFVGQEVKLVGKGTETEIRGKKYINLSEIISIEKVKGEGADVGGGGKGL